MVAKRILSELFLTDFLKLGNVLFKSECIISFFHFHDFTKSLPSDNGRKQLHFTQESGMKYERLVGCYVRHSKVENSQCFTFF